MTQMTGTRRKINSLNDRLLLSLSFVFFMPLLFDFISGLTMGQSRNVTIAIYGITFVAFFVMGRQSIKPSNFLPLVVIYAICTINVLLFPESRKYFETAQFLNLFYYIPLSFVLFRNIKEWSNFIPVLFRFSPIAVLMGGYSLMFAQIQTADISISYMEFSYALLPFVCASYAYYISKRRIVGLILFIIGLVEMLAFGCRGAVVSALIFAILLAVLKSKTNKWGLILLSVVTIAIAVNIVPIINYLSGISIFEDSYILRRAINAEMFEVSSRETILMNCEKRLSSMGLEISGLFGDRPYCGSVYPHNIVYEVFMQWGWILGTFLLLYLSSLFVKGFVRNSTSRFVTLFFVCSILLRFFISGSYLNSGLFWLMIACMLSIKNLREIKVNNNE